MKGNERNQFFCFFFFSFSYKKNINLSYYDHDDDDCRLNMYIIIYYEIKATITKEEKKCLKENFFNNHLEKISI